MREDIAGPPGCVQQAGFAAALRRAPGGCLALGVVRRLYRKTDLHGGPPLHALHVADARTLGPDKT